MKPLSSVHRSGHCKSHGRARWFPGSTRFSVAGTSLQKEHVLPWGHICPPCPHHQLKPCHAEGGFSSWTFLNGFGRSRDLQAFSPAVQTSFPRCWSLCPASQGEPAPPAWTTIPSIHAVLFLSLETPLKCAGEKLNVHVSLGVLTWFSCSWKCLLGDAELKLTCSQYFQGIFL